LRTALTDLLFLRSHQILLLIGCVDASSATCHYNLKRDRSILIFIGGEKEQLMTEPGCHKIYLLNRKGFVKLALQYGCDLIPMVT
jgi:2-acylglycerol O-acyltransferase 2